MAKIPTFKKLFLKPPSCSLKSQSLQSSLQNGIKAPLSLPSHTLPLSFNITKVDKLPVSNLAPPQHLAPLPLNEDQPRMNSAGENVQKGGSQKARAEQTLPPEAMGSTAVPGLWTLQCQSGGWLCLSPPLHSWQGVFLLLFPLLLSWFQAQCLLVLQPKINSRHSEGYSLDIRIEHCLRERTICLRYCFPICFFPP